MAEISADSAAPAPRRRRPVLLGLLLALAMGAGGFAATYTGFAAALIEERLNRPSAAAESVFVPVEQMTISLASGAPNRHLRFAATLEVPRREQAEVTRLMPRIRDVMNGYLRAVDPAEFDRPGALVRMRAQLLRRVQIVAGEGRVRDLLISEFVLN